MKKFEGIHPRLLPPRSLSTRQTITPPILPSTRYFSPPSHKSNATPPLSPFATEIKDETDLLAPGAAPGTIPNDLEQSTGLERLEILGKMQGIDIFDMKPLPADRKGTLDDPVMVRSFGDEQYCGCTGVPADTHVVVWLTVRDPHLSCKHTAGFMPLAMASGLAEADGSLVMLHRFPANGPSSAALSAAPSTRWITSARRMTVTPAMATATATTPSGIQTASTTPMASQRRSRTSSSQSIVTCRW